jgi:hypothetical protein
MKMRKKEQSLFTTGVCLSASTCGPCGTKILGHLRGPGPHVHGYHILDALLAIAVRTVKLRWMKGRLQVQQALGGAPFDDTGSPE